MAPAGDEARLSDVLTEARHRSLIGRPAPDLQIAHSLGFLEVLLLEPLTGPVLDLGAGGGLPGLVLASHEPDLDLVLVDSSHRSVDFLLWAVNELGLSERVEVVLARAEEVGRDPRYRELFSAVVARGFARPAVTAECAAPLLEVGGRLIVSEPPPSAPGKAGGAPPEPAGVGEDARWPAEACGKLGLAPEERWYGQHGFMVLRKFCPCPDRYPRRTGVPARRPLFS